MFRNCYYDKKKSEIHLWETINGERQYKKEPWVPFLFLPTKKESKIKSIFGDNVFKQEFNSFKQYDSYNTNKEIKKFEDKVKPELQYLSEKYYSIPDEEISKPDIKIAAFDIEVISEKGFPKPEDATGFVSSIAVKTNFGETKAFGLKEYSGKFKDCFEYCEDEIDLFKKFFSYMNKLDMDVLTGYYINNFDLPYLYNRCKVLFGNRRQFSKLSPINRVNVWEKRDKTGLNIDIAGVSILDYIEVYKKYTSKNVSSFKLDDVAFDELGETKQKFEGTLKELYENDWNLYIDYNIQDVDLILKLEQKLKFINLIQTTSLISRCPMKFYDKVTNVLEGIFLTYYRRNDLCAPKLEGGVSQNFEAAFVKEPQKGIKKWVGDLDVTSMYPYLMIVLNMSPETYFGCIVEKTESEIIESVKKKEFKEFNLEKKDKKVVEIKGTELEQFNKLLKDKKINIAPNGAVFKTTKQGVVSTIERKFFKSRKQIKDKMLKAKKLSESKDKINELNTSQLSTKIILNSIYGAISTPYFRLYNLRIAEAITSAGRHLLRNSDKFINEFLNSKTDEGTQVFDFVKYCDTDSVDGDSYIYINNKKIKIKDYYNKLNVSETTRSKDNFIKNINNNDVSLSVNKEKEVENKKVKYIKKHKVSKRMYRIKRFVACPLDVDHQNVIVTEDHSIIILRFNELLSVKPNEMERSDSIIIKENDGFIGSDFEIEELGIQERWVYDIEVEDNHNFFANDILVHNSHFIGLDEYISNNKKVDIYFKTLDLKGKSEFVIKIFKQIEKAINTYSFEEIQQNHFNSPETEFKLNWKQEIIAPSILFVEKKKYGLWCINDEGVECDEIKATGLDIIKSETSKEIKDRLKHIMEMILKNKPVEDIRAQVSQYKKELKNVSYEDLSINMGVNNINKYIGTEGPIKGTPWHLKGVHAYNVLIKENDLGDKYEEVAEGEKARVIYLKKNKYNFDSLTYPHDFPHEIKNIQPDIEKMIDKYFIKKIELIANPANMLSIINESEENLNFFF